MAFFPLANTFKATGYCILHNYPPNNWEPIEECQKFVWAIYTDGNKWKTKHLGLLEAGESKKYNYSDILQERDKERNPLVLLQFRATPLGKKLDILPKQEFIYNKVPEWRATVGFSLNQAETSYQGEINPFPKKASLLTFHPFIQYNKIENYFLFFNAENSPRFRSEFIEIYEANTKRFIDKVKVTNNCCNMIPIDKYDFSPDELPVFLCRSMAGIPFGFGISKNGEMLSLEHTHPPASFVVHGQRFKVQGEIKRQWLTMLKH